MVNDLTQLIPEIPLKAKDWEEAERQLYENFFILRELLKDGVTGTIYATNGGVGYRYSFTKGILTGIATAT